MTASGLQIALALEPVEGADPARAARELRAKLAVLNGVPSACVRAWPAVDGETILLALAIHPDRIGRIDACPIPATFAGLRVDCRPW